MGELVSNYPQQIRGGRPESQQKFEKGSFSSQKFLWEKQVQIENRVLTRSHEVLVCPTMDFLRMFLLRY